MKEEGYERFYASYGTFMHDLLDGFYEGVYQKDELAMEFLTNFSVRVKGERPAESTVQSYIMKGVEYLNTFEPFVFDKIEVEKELSFAVDGRPFIGFVDILGENDGDFYIVDHKSRDLGHRSKRKKPTLKDLELDEMLKQLYVYSEGVFQTYGKYPEELWFNCFKNQTIIKEKFDPERHQEVMRWLVQTIEYIEEATDFPPQLDYFRCNYLCDHRENCVYYDTHFGKG